MLQEITPGGTQYFMQEHLEKGHKITTNPAFRSASQDTMEAKVYNDTSGIIFEPKTTKIIQTSSDESVLNISPKHFKPSPQQSSEKVYSKALDKHKARVNQIRQCIKSAVIIQRAWRRYKQSLTFIIK